MSSTERLALGIILVLALLVRIVPILSATVAVGDGGLFYAMVDDIRSTGLAVPESTSYNALGIPFVYPPIAMWVTAALGEALGVATMDLLRWIPLIFSMLGVGAFAWLAWRLLPPVGALGAALMYSLMPHAYDWVIAGGGLTRGLGLFFALLAMAVAADRSSTSFRTALAAGILLGLSAISHPQAAVFGVLGCLVVSYRSPVRAWLAQAGVAAGGAALLVIPWLVGVINTHGSDVLLAPGHRVETITGLIRLLSLEFSGAPFMDLFAVLGIVGLVISLARRQPRLPVLLLLTYLAGAGGGEFMGAVPWALLGGVGAQAILGLIREAIDGLGRARRRAISLGLAAGLLFLALSGSFGSFIAGGSKLHALSPDQIAALRWVAENTDSGTKFIIPTADVWGDDEQSEWFPAIAERHSLGTVQGAEWLGYAGYRQQLLNHAQIRSCEGGATSCYEPVGDGRAAFFVFKGPLAGPFSNADCCIALRESLATGAYEIVYDGPGATVAIPRSPGATIAEPAASQGD